MGDKVTDLFIHFIDFTEEYFPDEQMWIFSMLLYNHYFDLICTL